jgi:hypothetical protein
VNRKQIERAEKTARRLEARAHKVQAEPRVDAEALRTTEVYQRRLETIQAVREASRWIRPASLGVARVTMMEARGRVEPAFEDWQLAIALDSLDRRSG